MEPVPFAVIAERAWLDEKDRLNLTGISDTITVDGFPTAVREFHMVAIFEMSPAEVDREESVVVRLVDPDGGEIDIWRVRGQEVPKSGRTLSSYRLMMKYTNMPFVTSGAHELRIQHDDRAAELCITFEMKQGAPDV